MASNACPQTHSCGEVIAIRAHAMRSPRLNGKRSCEPDAAPRDVGRRSRHQCRDAKVGVSAIERLHSGGVRLVCMSTAGADLMRKTLKKHLIFGEDIRERH